MATSYSDRLKNFASAIIAEDMSDSVLEKQQQLFGPCVGNKLPVDTVSKPGKCIFFSQLIETRGDIGVKVYKKCCACYSSDSQDQAIFASSAASGTGKTHGVYAAGKHMFSLVIRVGTSSDEINGGAVLSSPWEELVKTITAIREYYLRQNEVDGVPVSFEKRKECAHYAYTCIKLLVSCYMAVSIDALRLETSPSLSEAQQREFLLRFHRNCISEDLVRERFLCELDFHRNSYTSECHLLDAESVNNFCNGLEMSFSQQVLICFDEIPALKDYFPKLFIDSETYLKNDEPEPGDASIHRGLLYAVACCMVSLSNSTKWAMLMTGTSFSLTQFSCSGQGLSPVRGCVEAVSPDKMLDVSDMQALLQHYFNLSDGTLEDVAVVSMLKRCCGRPLIFVNIVLKRIFDTLLFSKCKVDEVGVELLLGSWTDFVANMQSVYQRLFRNLLSISPRLLPHGSDGSTKSLAPLLLSALLFNKGIMNLPDDDVVAEAIRCSIIPVSSSVGGKWVDITAEPIVEEALRKVLVQMADDKKEIIMRLVLSGVKCQDKGITAETAFTYFLVLCSFVNIQKQRPNLLSGLIAPFFENIHQQPPQLSAFTCEVTTLVDMSGWAAEGNCFLRRFVKEDGSYDTSILLVNIPITAGVDVAFLVVNKSAPLNSPLRTRLVALQLKNRKKGQLKSALLTIHSGTQYMTNKQREYAIHNATRTPRDAEEDWLNKFPRSDSGGIDFLEWNDYQNQFAANHPVLCNKWIRIAVFAQPIHDTIYNFLQDFPSNISSLYRQVNIDEGITGSTVSNSEGAKLDDHSDYADDEEEEVDDPEVKRLEVAADSSPVVVLTMNSKNWLTEKFRSDFIDSTSANLYLPNSKNIIPYFDHLTVSAVRGAQCISENMPPVF